MVCTQTARQCVLVNFLVDCLVESWSQWTECLREGKACGYKWGNQTRSRAILQQPSPNGNLCPDTTQTQRCKLKERYCNSVNSDRFSGNLHRNMYLVSSDMYLVYSDMYLVCSDMHLMICI